MSLKTQMITAALMLAGSLGISGVGDIREAAAAQGGYEPKFKPGHHRYRGTPYSASPESKADRFNACRRGCRPPARRHYGPSVKPMDLPKRMRDRRAWRALMKKAWLY